MTSVGGTEPETGSPTLSAPPTSPRGGEGTEREAALTALLGKLATRLRIASSRIHRRSGPARFLSLSVRVGVLLLTAVGLEFVLERLTRLQPDAYLSTSLLGAVFERILTHRAVALVLIPFLCGAVAIALLRRSLGPRWRDFDHGRAIRLLLLVAAGLLAWIHSTYPYNFYYLQSHWFERLLLLGLVPLIAWRPVFLLPFLLTLLPVLWQFRQPIGGFSSAAPMLPIRMLILAGAFWGLRLVTRRIRGADLLFLICCLVFAQYWVPGLAKWRLGWLADDQIAFLLPATYANGWLGFLDSETISTLTRGIASLNTPAKIFTLLVECGALVALWRPTTTRLVLLGAIVLHGAVFLVSGINFWMWSVLSATLFVLFFRPRQASLPIFTSSHVLLSLALIGGGAIWFKPTPLAWLDSRMSYTYRLEALGASGRSYELPPRFFAPYDYQFTLSGFGYLSPAPQLGITWGGTWSRELAAAFEKSTSSSEVLAIESAMGESRYDPERAAAFENFVRTFITHWHERDGNLGWWTRAAPPRLLWTYSRGPEPDPRDRIRSVAVLQVTSIFDDRHYVEIRTRPVRVIDIPSPPAGVDRGRRTD